MNQFSVYALDDLVVNDTPLKNVQWPYLFAYMHRRFGPPHIGGDDYKDLSASWVLTTPNPDVFIRILPRLSGVCSFDPYIFMGSNYVRSHEPLPSIRLKEIATAYRATLIDLLRPVCVRDSKINALGNVDDDSPLMEWDEESEESLYEVDYYHGAGYPMPLGLFGGDDWANLCGLIEYFGKGNYNEGRKAVIVTLLNDVLLSIQNNETEATKILIASQIDPNKNLQIYNGLGLSEESLVEAAHIKKALFLDENTELKIPDFKKSDIDRADTLLDTMNIYSDLNGSIKKFHFNRQLKREWSEMRSACKGNFPENTIPDKVFLCSSSDLRKIPNQLHDAGEMKLYEWAKQLLKREDGIELMRNILAQISYELRQESNQWLSAAESERDGR